MSRGNAAHNVASITTQTSETPAIAAPSPRRLRRISSKRAAIISAGLRLFSRFGLQGATLDQIAEAADLSKTNVLYYFPSKDDIYRAVLDDVLRRWLEPLQAIDGDRSPDKVISTYIVKKLEFSRDHPEASRLFCSEILRGAPLIQAELTGALKEIVDSKASVFAAWAAAGKIQNVDPYHIIFSIWATTQHYADFSVQVAAVTGSTLDDPCFFEQVVRSVTTLILDGVRPRRDRGS